mgnify:CR=1 FL=1
MLSAVISWTLFFSYRKVFIEELAIDFTNKFYLGIVLIPVFWIILYGVTGTYKNIFRKSRLKELSETFYIVLIGTIIIFFVALLDDYIDNYKTYYSLFVVLFCAHLFFTSLFRFLLTSITAKKVHQKKISFNTLIIGSNLKAVQMYKELKEQKLSSGYHFVGFVNVEEKAQYLLSEFIPKIGSLENIVEVIKDHDIEDVIIAVESAEHHKIEEIIDLLEGTDIYIKMLPDMYDIISGKVKMSTIFGTALIEIEHELMPTWHWFLKRFFDVSISLFVIILFSPLYLFTALLATWVISKFGATIEQMVALAFLMPIVASMGGNAGMQTLAVTIRALATKELSSGNISTIVTKEFIIGVLNGIIFAIITGIIVQLWFKEINLSILIAASMVLNMIVAGLFGILVPVSLKKFNIDPAIASSVFVTTITDVIGFLSFLGLGAYFFYG